MGLRVNGPWTPQEPSWFTMKVSGEHNHFVDFIGFGNVSEHRSDFCSEEKTGSSDRSCAEEPSWEASSSASTTSRRVSRWQEELRSLSCFFSS